MLVVIGQRLDQQFPPPYKTAVYYYVANEI